MTAGGSFERAWQDRRRRRLALVVWVVLLFPYMWLLAVAPVGENRALYLLPWLLVGAVLGGRVLLFRCPGCHRFFGLSTSIGAYSIKPRIACIHCGLGIGAPYY